MADAHVALRPQRHRRSDVPRIPAVEHQLARAVVPRALQLDGDAPSRRNIIAHVVGRTTTWSRRRDAPECVGVHPAMGTGDGLP